MLNAKTLRVQITRDVIWLKIMYFAPAKVTQGPAIDLIENYNYNTIKYGESVRKVIYDGDDGVNALTHVESDVDGITCDDGNVEGNTKAGNENNDPTGTDEKTNDNGGQWQQVTTTKSSRVSGRVNNLAQYQSK